MTRILRRVFLVFLAAVLASLVAFVGFDVWATRKADSDLARLEQKYGFLAGRSIVAPAVAPADNSARLVRTAAAGDTHDRVLAVAQIGVALRRYRGSYPDDLSALVPAYLAQLPIDRVTGKPPVYARNSPGFTLKAASLTRDSPMNAALDWTIAR